MGAIFKIAPGVAALTFGRDAIFFILLSSPRFEKSCGKQSSGETKFIRTMAYNFTVSKISQVPKMLNFSL